MSKLFERTLEAATDQVVVDTDWSGIMECIDMVRGKDISAKDAVAAISRRLKNSNPNVVHHTLVLLEACMKNCGTAFHAEVMSTRFLDQLKDIVVSSPPGKVQEKTLELIQIWHSAFAKKQEYAAISDVHRILKHHGYNFPPAKESDAMFAAQCAPDWVDGDQCFRCRTEFGMFTRKHHCRACGQIFCDRCSSHQVLLPQFGIEKKVRVCDTCFEKNNKKIPTQAARKDDEDEKRRLKELEDKEEEELALAIALSQSEAEHKKQFQWSSPPAPVVDTNSYTAPFNDGTDSIYKGSSMSVVDDRPLPADNMSVDSNLARYLDRVYWEKKLNDTTTANAPPPSDTSYSSYRGAQNNSVQPSGAQPMDYMKANMDPVYSGDITEKSNQKNNYYLEDAEVDKTKGFCESVRERIDTMDNRMRSNQMRGRSIVNDSSIHSLFVQLTEMHGDVLERMGTLENHRDYYERLQEHLAHIQQSREAVTALREEHERLRQERLMAEQRERQAQMQQKLQVMRMKKHEMLLHQRHMALQRFQEQEQNMQQRRMPVQPGYPQTGVPNDIMPMNYSPQSMYQQQPINMNPPAMYQQQTSTPQHMQQQPNTPQHMYSQPMPQYMNIQYAPGYNPYPPQQHQVPQMYMDPNQQMYHLQQQQQQPQGQPPQ